MNCPGHILVFNSNMRSYRDLPLRYGEFGSCHRNEPSGALHGLMRVRGFTQDDGHIFCSEEQIQPEVTAFNQQALAVYRDFGFDQVTIKLALRPDQRLGTDDTWDRAESALRARLERLRSRMDRAAGRRRLLRTEDRVPPEGLAGPLVAMRHDAGRFFDAGAARRRIRGRGQHAARYR